MVIQRTWRTSSQSIESSSVNQTSSSEDSNSSWQTASNSTSSSSHPRNGLNGNISSSKATNTEMAKKVLNALKTRYNGRNSLEQTAHELAEHSMELMRLNIQHLFDKEIQIIVQKYIETYFSPALRNIKENLDETGITDDYLERISRNLLENAKQQYKVKEEPIKTEIKTEPLPTIKIEPVQTIEQPTISYRNISLKRKDSTSSSSEVSSSDQSPPHSIKRMPTATNFQINAIPRPKQVFWNIAAITPETLFIFDFKANRALGYFERERLTNQHPELIRYMTDSNDKEWLIQQRLLSPTHRNFRILLLVLDEVVKVSQSEECRKRTNLRLNELTGFKVPESMQNKMKIFFNELSQKSKTLAASSTSYVFANGSITIPALASATNLSNAITTLQPIETQLATTSSLSSITGKGQPTTVLLVDTSGNGTKTATVTRAFLTTTPTQISQRSSLSSSHATLSALLNSAANENNYGATVATITTTEMSE